MVVSILNSKSIELNKKIFADVKEILKNDWYSFHNEIYIFIVNNHYYFTENNFLSISDTQEDIDQDIKLFGYIDKKQGTFFPAK
jgi:hypothetical protein